jgi:hypothetical protein
LLDKVRDILDMLYPEETQEKERGWEVLDS